MSVASQISCDAFRPKGGNASYISASRIATVRMGMSDIWLYKQPTRAVSGRVTLKIAEKIQGPCDESAENSIAGVHDDILVWIKCKKYWRFKPRVILYSLPSYYICVCVHACTSVCVCVCVWFPNNFTSSLGCTLSKDFA